MTDVIELNVSAEDKETLRCANCGGYLLWSPIRILPNGNNICGHCHLNNDVICYRNTTLEALLKHAVFPCKFRANGCQARIRFSSACDHEKCCSFNHSKTNENQEGIIFVDDEISTTAAEPPSTSQSSPSTSQSVKDKVIPPLMKSSNSVYEPPNIGDMNTKHEPASQAGGTSTGNNASECSETPSTRWNNQSRGNRPRSFASDNRSPGYWYRRRNYAPQQPYHVDWRSNNLCDRQFHPDHVMFKRRNNVIIIKGGTFYVNW
ncbi:uncharacterized protein LOC116166488 isoform X1 [Photinus pyralis]|uniref:uncharacterized protein LOC116166488 isoform X1 n=1 Tax=Photinus pyralis TaxID=7054 RepID=UPI001267487F|nr:uncharacterized protein LOC116166488 isoform X1 [Photinus pyralis]